jgi:hypothetical protein
MNMKKTILVSSYLLLAAGCASTPSSSVRIPEALKPGAKEKLALVARARGEQIYECREKKDQAGVYDWAFIAPLAQLYDAGGRRIGRHYAGPTWQADDGSKIVGTVKQHADAPAAGAIPWLLLEANSVGREGAFSKVTSVQRVSTVGGVAPSNGCLVAGVRVEIPYTAEYHFFTTN